MNGLTKMSTKNWNAKYLSTPYTRQPVLQNPSKELSMVFFSVWRCPYVITLGDGVQFVIVDGVFGPVISRYCECVWIA